MNTQSSHPAMEEKPSSRAWLLLLGIIAVSLNLRPCITAVAPLAPEMLSAGITEAQIGLLTTIPLLLFGLAGFFCGTIGLRLGQSRAIALGLLIMIVGIAVRFFGGWILGSILIGTGIAFGNVLLPGLVKAHFSERAGLITGIYSTAINFGSAIGIATVGTIAVHSGGSWNNALSFWMIPAIIAILLWIPWLRMPRTLNANPSTFSSILKSKRSWQVALHLGALAWVFFSTIAWLPSILKARGMETAAAANWISAAQIFGCVASLTIPILAARRASQSSFVVGSNLTIGLALAGILLLPLATLPTVIFLLGCGLNASFALSLLLITKRSATPAQAGQLSALAQAIGYIVSAPGPWFTGVIADSSANWTTPTITILIAVLATAITGHLAGRAGNI